MGDRLTISQAILGRFLASPGSTQKELKNFQLEFPEVKLIPQADDVSKELFSALYKHGPQSFNSINLLTGGRYADSVGSLGSLAEDNRSITEDIESLCQERDKSALVVSLLKGVEELSSGKATVEETIASVKSVVKPKTLVMPWEERIDIAQKTMQDSLRHGPDLVTGLAELDALYTFRRGMVSVIAAATSHGKTMMAARLALNAADAARPLRVAMLVFEDEYTLPYKLAAQRHKVPLDYFTRYHMATPSQKEQADLAMSVSREGLREKLFIFGPMPLPSFEARLEEVKPDVIIFDYIQRYVERYGGEAKREAVGASADEFHRIVERFNAFGVLCSQIRRRPSSGEGGSGAPRRPCLFDLKESGDLENYADGVLLLYWPWKDKVYEENTLKKEEYWVDIAKDKLGRCGSVKLRFKGEVLALENFYEGG